MKKYALMRKRALEEAAAKAKVAHLPYLALEKKGRFPATAQTLSQQLAFLQQYLWEYKWSTRKQPGYSHRFTDTSGGGYQLFGREHDDGDLLAIMGRVAGLYLQDIKTDPATGSLLFIFDDKDDLFRIPDASMLITMVWKPECESSLDSWRQWFTEWESDPEVEYQSLKQSTESDHLSSEQPTIFGSSILAAWILTHKPGKNTYYFLWDNGQTLIAFLDGHAIYLLTEDLELAEIPALVKDATAVMVVRRPPK